MRRALADAGLTTDDVGYVSGHGTGTPANDAMEAKVMRAVFGPRAGQVPTSSIKSFVGHTLGAAGAVEGGRRRARPARRHRTAHDRFRPRCRAGRPRFRAEPRARALDRDGRLQQLRLRREQRLTGPDHAGRRTGGGGTVSPGGRDHRARAGQRARGRRRRDHRGHPGRPPGAGRAALLEGRTFAPRSLWRHMNHLSRMAIAAARLSWEDAGLKLPRKELDDVGLVFATGAGSAESTGGFDDSIAANPNKPAVLSFSNVVLNATGGAVCQTLGLRGPTTTICNGGASASIALDCAVEMISEGKADVVLVVAADEHVGVVPQDAIAPPYDRDSQRVPGSAAVAFVVEAADHCAARGGSPYARVLGTSHVSGPFDGLTGLAGLTEPLDLVVGAATGGDDDAEEAASVLAALPGVPLTASAGLTGDCQAATGALNIALAALAIRDGVAPALTGLATPAAGDLADYLGEPDLPEPARRALVLSSAPGSVRGAVLLGAT